MNSATATRSRNRRALAVFIGMLVVLVGTSGVVVAWLQSRQLLEEARGELRSELTLLGDMALEPLLRSDLAAVERLTQIWVSRHDYMVRVTAQMPNGFVLSDQHRVAPAVEPLTVEHVVALDGRTLLTLRAVGDFSIQASEHASIVLNASLISSLLILLFGAASWVVLQRIAIQPLEQEVAARELRERELKQRTLALEVAIKELESFSYSVSHDLRGPLRAIDGFTHALDEDYAAALDDTARLYLARTRAAAQRMGLLIDDLLALARMARQEVTMAEVDLSERARAALEKLAQENPEREVEVDVMADLRVMADARLLDVALDNLLGNAWKYTSLTEHAQIEFGARRDADSTVYFVRDNGAGFDMAYADKLFKPFQRLHGQEFEGTGVGLATVNRIIQRHGGRIWAEAAPGRGATFYFTLGPSA